MRNQSPALCTREQLLQECEEARLRIAFFDLQESEIEAYEAIANKDECVANLATEKQSTALELIRRRTKAIRTKRFGRNALVATQRLAKVVAVVIAIIVLGLTTVFAVTPSFQIAVRDLLIRVTDQYAEIGIKDNRTMIVPQGWTGEYFPSYIPKGFRLQQKSENAMAFSFVEYKDATGKFIIYFEAQEGSRSNIDTEGARITTTTVHDHEAMVVEKENRITVSWVEDERYFVIMFDGEMSEAISIARSVQRVR